MKHSVSARRNSANAGFTLIETLAALAIAGAVFAVIAEFAGRTLRNWHHGEATIAVMEMLTRGLSRLQIDLASVVPMSPPGTDNSTVYFAGDSSALRFVAATGFGTGNRGIELLNIAATSDHDDVLLLRQRGPVLNPATQLGDPVVLMRGRIRVQFSYREASGRTVKSWANRPDLPSAVQVQVLAQDGTPVFPSAFVLPIPVTLGIDCLTSGELGLETPPRCGNLAAQDNTQSNTPPPQVPDPRAQR